VIDQSISLVAAISKKVSVFHIMRLEAAHVVSRVRNTYTVSDENAMYSLV